MQSHLLLRASLLHWHTKQRGRLNDKSRPLPETEARRTGATPARLFLQRGQGAADTGAAYNLFTIILFIYDKFGA
jgi:hypothetical protein